MRATVKKSSFIKVLAISLIAIMGGIMSSAEAAQNSDLSKRIQVLEDRAAIKEVVDTFSILADQKETQKQTLLFTEDATVETYVGEKVVALLKGREQIGQAFAGFLKNFDVVYHINGQQTITLNGDVADTISYCEVTLVGMENGKRIKVVSNVHYKDKFVRQNGKWLISSRTANFAFQDKGEVK